MLRDTIILGADTNTLLDNSQVHLQHNRRQYAEYEGRLQAAQDAVRRPTGRIAHFKLGQVSSQPFTTDMAASGLTREDLDNFRQNMVKLSTIANKQDFSFINLWGMAASCCIEPICCCKGMEPFYEDHWDAWQLESAIQQWMQPFNRSLQAKGAHAAFTVQFIEGVGILFDIEATP